MSVAVFVGPSLPPSERLDDPRIVWLPPVSQGDLLPIVGSGNVSVIAVIDGYFESVPAVLHKEILWALENGIHVVGGASMGALRAAELHALGMVGVGRIFEDYRDGILIDDDEVAVLHGPGDAGYLALSDAMVDVRATVAAAETAGLIDAEETERVLLEAKKRFYKERRLPDALRSCRVDRKRQDARLVVCRALELADAPPPVKDWRFGWTDAFDMVARGHKIVIARLDRFEQALLDELRLAPDLYRPLRDRALLIGQARHGCEAAAEIADLDRVNSRYEIYARHDLWTGEAQRRWRMRTGLSEDALERLAVCEAAADQRFGCPPDWFWPILIDLLRASPDFERLRSRAEARACWLEKNAEGLTSARDYGIHPAELRRRYFDNRLGEPVPENIEGWSRRHGFDGSEDFHRALLIDLIVCAQSE